MTPALIFGSMVTMSSQQQQPTKSVYVLASPGGVWCLHFTSEHNSVMHLTLTITNNPQNGSAANTEELVVPLDPEFAVRWGFADPQIVLLTEAWSGDAVLRRLRMKNYDKKFCRGLWNQLVGCGWSISHE